MTTLIFHSRGRHLSIERDDRIIGGRYADHGEWPTSVAISFRPGKSSCGANILTPLTLLTACHCTVELSRHNESSSCTKDRSYWDVSIVAGSISRVPYDFQGFQVRFVYYWERHPKCARLEKTEEWLYDIAVIHLTEELIYNDLVKPVTIPRNQMEFKAVVDLWQELQKECQVAGWGFTAAKVVKDDGGVEELLGASELLKVMDVKLQTIDECLNRLCQWENIVPRYDCKRRYRYHGPDRICAVPTKKYRNGSVCGGDSGGPLRCDDVLVGVVSYGPMCSDHGEPIVFARVDAALPYLLPFLDSGATRSEAFSTWKTTNLILLALYSLLSMTEQ